MRVLSEQKQEAHCEKPALDCVVFAHTYPSDRLQLTENASDAEIAFLLKQVTCHG